MVEYRGFVFGEERENPYEREVDRHHPDCKIPKDRRAMRDVGKKDRVDVGLQRDFEPTILTACGMKVLRCWLDTHYAICFERNGACFYPEAKTEKN